MAGRRLARRRSIGEVRKGRCFRACWRGDGRLREQCGQSDHNCDCRFRAMWHVLLLGCFVHDIHSVHDAQNGSPHDQGGSIWTGVKGIFTCVRVWGKRMHQRAFSPGSAGANPFSRAAKSGIRCHARSGCNDHRPALREPCAAAGYAHRRCVPRRRHCCPRHCRATGRAYRPAPGGS